MTPNELSEVDHAFRVELFRKGIHLCSLAIPIFYFYTPRPTALQIFVPMTLAFVLVDIARYYHKPSIDWFYSTFGWLLREHESDKEKKRLNGASYVMIAATLSVLMFPKIIALTSLALFSIADITAALIGKRFGKHPFFGKTLEGSLAFFLSGIIVIALAPKIEYQLNEYIIQAIAAGVGTLVEALPIEIDDNLSVPLSVGATMWALYHFALPTLNIYALS